jgi:hypothetical protein
MGSHVLIAVHSVAACIMRGNYCNTHPFDTRLSLVIVGTIGHRLRLEPARS